MKFRQILCKRETIRNRFSYLEGFVVLVGHTGHLLDLINGTSNVGMLKKKERVQKEKIKGIQRNTTKEAESPESSAR